MATLSVGTGKQFATIAAAVAAAKDGDTVAVAAGTYRNDFAVIRTRITLIAIGGLVTMTSTAATAPAKALLAVTADAVIDGFAFTNMHAADGTGAGILVQAGAVTIRNSLFTGNQNGLLATANAATQVTIQASELAANGNRDGFSSNIQVGAIKSLTVTGSYIHDAASSTELRSRAAATTITTSRIENNAGTAGLAIDLPAAGAVTLTRNTIEKAATATTAIAIRYGSESTQPASSLTVTGNTIAADRPGAVLVQNLTTVTASIAANTTFGIATLATGPAALSANATAAARPATSTAPLIPPVTAPTAVPPVTAPTAVPPVPTPVAPTNTHAPNLASATIAAAVATLPTASQSGQLILRVSETAWHGDAQFNVLVDGVAVGGTMTATATHAAGKSQLVTIAGAFTPGPHVVAVKFVNSLGSGDAAIPGRALYVDAMTFNGQDAHQAAALTANGTALLATAPVSVPTHVTVRLSEDAPKPGDDALAFISIDGKVQGGIQTVTAAHGAASSLGLDFLLDLAPGTHTASVALLNSAPGRALYVDAMTLLSPAGATDIVAQSYAAAARLEAGSTTFAFTVAPPPAANGAMFVTIGAPQDIAMVLPH